MLEKRDLIAKLRPKNEKMREQKFQKWFQTEKKVWKGKLSKKDALYNAFKCGWIISIWFYYERLKYSAVYSPY